MAGGPAYTEIEDGRIREFFARRVSSRAIAADLGRSVQSVRHRIKHLGLRHTNWFWTPDEDAKLRNLAAAHVPVEEIATMLSRTISSVRKRQFDLDIPRDNRKTRLAKRYGVEVLANGKDPVVILAEIREAEEHQRKIAAAEQQVKINAMLDEMERGLSAGCDRAFMFTAALVGGATLQAIGDRVGLTRERVRQVIEERAAKATGSG